MKRRLFIALIAALGLAQLIGALRAATLPPELAAQVSLSLLLEFLLGVMWAGIFWTCVYLHLARPKVFALRLTLIALAAFAVLSVARLMVFVQAEYDRQRLPFLIVALSVILAVGFAVRRLYNTAGD